MYVINYYNLSHNEHLFELFLFKVPISIDVKSIHEVSHVLSRYFDEPMFYLLMNVAAWYFTVSILVETIENCIQMLLIWVDDILYIQAHCEPLQVIDCPSSICVKLFNQFLKVVMIKIELCLFWVIELSISFHRQLQLLFWNFKDRIFKLP